MTKIPAVTKYRAYMEDQEITEIENIEELVQRIRDDLHSGSMYESIGNFETVVLYYHKILEEYWELLSQHNC